MEKIDKKINQLGEEANNLVSKRERLEQALRDIDVRLTQIVGAIFELESLKKEYSIEGPTEQNQELS